MKGKRKNGKKNRNLHQKWPEIIKKGITLDRGLLVIVLYTFFQGVHSFKLAISHMMVLHMDSQMANITFAILLLSIGSLVGATGLYNRKRWSRQLVLTVYTIIMPLMVFIIRTNTGAYSDIYFLAMRVLDIAIAAGIIFYHSKGRIREEFEQAGVSSIPA